jgi:hypothetical protein
MAHTRTARSEGDNFNSGSRRLSFRKPELPGVGPATARSINRFGARSTRTSGRKRPPVKGGRPHNWCLGASASSVNSVRSKAMSVEARSHRKRSLDRTRCRLVAMSPARMMMMSGVRSIVMSFSLRMPSVRTSTPERVLLLRLGHHVGYLLQCFGQRLGVFAGVAQRLLRSTVGSTLPEVPSGSDHPPRRPL